MTTTSDNEVFSALWRDAENSVLKYVVSFVGRQVIAEEIVQEVAFICLQRLPTFERERNFTAWALGIARLEIFTHRRRHILFPLSEMSEIETVLGDPEEFIQQQNQERSRALQRCVKKLAGQQKRLLELHYGNNHTYEEMSAILHIQISTITVALSRVRSFLRTCINQYLSQTGEP
jgi:RNA polymerase sigma-70 factor, ECF subfamily